LSPQAGAVNEEGLVSGGGIGRTIQTAPYGFNGK
jgi:hypothetical protein